MAPKKSSTGGKDAKPPATPKAEKADKPAKAEKADKKSSGGKASLASTGSTDSLVELGEVADAAEEDVKARVKAWVKISAGQPSGIKAEDVMSVRSEADGTIIASYDGNNKKLEKASVDGVVAADASVTTIAGDLLGPLVDSICDKEGLEFDEKRSSVLFCYGEDGSGREEALIGSESLVTVAVKKILSHIPAGYVLQCAGTLILMELIFDLLRPESNLSINETQFSGLHVDGGLWKPVSSASDLSAILSTMDGQREVLREKHALGRSHRSVMLVSLRVAPSDGSAYGNIMYLVELAAPPMTRASGVSGLALEEFCSVNTSLKTLTKCLTAMGSRKKAATPPLRDSRLTHLLGSALGDDKSPVHCLVYVPGRRAKRAEAGAAIVWAAKATAARLKSQVFASAASKALVSQLQGVVASLEEPGPEMASEMREQMEPPSDALSQLRASVNGKAAMLSEVEQELMEQKQRTESQLSKNQAAHETRMKEQEEIQKAIGDLQEQIKGVKSGEKLQAAMDTLKRTIGEEKVALRKQVMARNRPSAAPLPRHQPATNPHTHEPPNPRFFLYPHCPPHTHDSSLILTAPHCDALIPPGERDGGSALCRQVQADRARQR